MTTIDDRPEPSQWDGYAAQNRVAIFSHCYAWGENLAAAYGLTIYRLAARAQGGNGRITGILPLVFFSPPGQEPRLISLPYTDAAGMVHDDRETGSDLLGAALDIAETLGAIHVELRQAGGLILPEPTTVAADRWHYRPHTFKTGLARPLTRSTDALWSKLPAKVRNQVRKARKCGCRVQVGGVERLDDFYTVFSENMRDLGSPVHSPDLFRGIFKTPSLGARVVVVYLDATPVAAAVVLRHNTTLFNPWASSLRRCRPSCPNMLLYWSMLEMGVHGGCNRFDFGRSSPGAPTCRFKEQWGAAMQPLAWHVFSKKPCLWNPRRESLVHEPWKSLDLETSRRQGPSIRRWISL